MINSELRNQTEKRICYNCIGESYLSKLVSDNGKRKKCSYCGTTTKSITIEDLTVRIQAVFEQFYQRTPENPDDYQYALMNDIESNYIWYRDGEPITDVIESDVSIPREAASDIQTILYERYYSQSANEIGEEQEFDEGSHYTYVGVDSKVWEERWLEFESSLKTETRYFNQFGKEYLEGIFKDLNRLNTIGGQPILSVGPSQSLSSVYRARVFLTDESLKNALEDIVLGLGPPPPDYAKAGRMNATGISVFYAASDEHTALSEVRPPVGSYVAIAKFSIIREIQLLNLIDLRSITIQGSVFDESYAELLSRIQFLNQLCDKMTVPVLPGAEDTEYLVTQAIADYLALNSQIKIDGIIFPSIQTFEGSNIVLFNRASKVANMSKPAGTLTTVSLWEHVEEGSYRHYTILEETPTVTADLLPSTIDRDSRVPTLAVDESSIQIHKIKTVKYNSDAQQVHIMRRERSDIPNFFQRNR